MRSRRILFGPPGTGKTTALLREVERHIKAGVAPERIGFVSFSRRALAEAKERVKGVTTAELPHFRTIHATAFHMLGLSHTDVLQSEHLKEFGQRAGLPFGTPASGQELWEGARGDRILALHHLAKARATSLEAEWRRAQIPDLPWVEVQRTAALYHRFKEAHALWDFSDMVELAEGTLDVDVLFVDEAQDTSTAQWNFLKRVARHVPTAYFAGDDDQAVYHWSGADPLQLLRFKGERTVLPQSYRLPRRVKGLADGIVRRIRVRVPKTFAPRDEEGVVDWVPDEVMVDLHRPGTFLLLARSNYQLRELRQLARQQGVVYTLANGEWSWTLPAVQAALGYEALRKGREVARGVLRHVIAYLPSPRPNPTGKRLYNWAEVFPDGGPPRDRTWMEVLTEMPLRDREYVRALRRSGESLVKPGRVRVGTVHSVKGAEADHVVLLTDVSERVAESAQADPDAEARVQYVGVTRALRSVTLVQPKSKNFWHF